MGLKTIDVKTADFDGNSVILEHHDDVSVVDWNKFVENGASAYYQPQVCISNNNAESLTSTTSSFWGCVPPSNPACLSTYDERTGIWISTEVTKITGTDCVMTLYGGTDMSSLGSIGGTTFSASGTYEGVIASDLAVPYYDTPAGSATPYYVRVGFQCTATGTGFSTSYTLDRLDCYYRKWVDVDVTYEGDGAFSFNSTTGSVGTITGTDGSGVAIASSFTGINVRNWSILTGTTPYTAEYVRFDATTGTGTLNCGYAGDTSPHSVYDYTRFSSTIKYWFGSADGTITTRYNSLITNDVFLDLWTFSGTSYAKIYGTDLDVGMAGTTITMGSWAATGTEGFCQVFFQGLEDNGTDRSLAWRFFTNTPFGVADIDVSVDVTGYSDDLSTVMNIDFMSADATCPFGVNEAVFTWSL